MSIAFLCQSRDSPGSRHYKKHGEKKSKKATEGEGSPQASGKEDGVSVASDCFCLSALLQTSV